jgi:hypothetical protein
MYITIRNVYYNPQCTLQSAMYTTIRNVYYNTQCTLQSAMYITIRNVYYNPLCTLQINISLNLPPDVLNKTTQISFVNHILIHFIKGHFQLITYAALLQGAVNLILFTLCYILITLCDITVNLQNVN